MLSVELNLKQILPKNFALKLHPPIRIVSAHYAFTGKKLQLKFHGFPGIYLEKIMSVKYLFYHFKSANLAILSAKYK